MGLLLIIKQGRKFIRSSSGQAPPVKSWTQSKSPNSFSTRKRWRASNWWRKWTPLWRKRSKGSTRNTTCSSSQPTPNNNYCCLQGISRDKEMKALTSRQEDPRSEVRKFLVREMALGYSKNTNRNHRASSKRCALPVKSHKLVVGFNLDQITLTSLILKMSRRWRRRFCSCMAISDLMRAWLCYTGSKTSS